MALRQGMVGHIITRCAKEILCRFLQSRHFAFHLILSWHTMTQDHPCRLLFTMQFGLFQPEHIAVHVCMWNYSQPALQPYRLPAWTAPCRPLLKLYLVCYMCWPLESRWRFGFPFWSTLSSVQVTKRFYTFLILPMGMNKQLHYFTSVTWTILDTLQDVQVGSLHRAPRFKKSLKSRCSW